MSSRLPVHQRIHHPKLRPNTLIKCNLPFFLIQHTSCQKHKVKCPCLDQASPDLQLGLPAASPLSPPCQTQEFVRKRMKSNAKTKAGSSRQFAIIPANSLFDPHTGQPRCVWGFLGGDVLMRAGVWSAATSCQACTPSGQGRMRWKPAPVL